MTVHRHTNDASHSRYYVCRHKTVDGVQTNECLSVSDRWGDFRSAWLMTGLDAARWIANERKEMCPYLDFTFCVGKVFIEVDGYFEIEVI